MHLFLSCPTKSCIPTKAKIHRKNNVRINTSDNINMDLRRALTIVFKPETKTKKIESLSQGVGGGLAICLMIEGNCLDHVLSYNDTALQRTTFR